MKLGGNFFEDLGPGQRLINPVPRTITDGDTALYIALTGDRNPTRLRRQWRDFC
jgi:acyl dehydratase